jgi:L,D-peptidoglycan transpeptidase YkuD (ErfK/YbiS/YcfS/YnhG family)
MKTEMKSAAQTRSRGGSFKRSHDAGNIEQHQACAAARDAQRSRVRNSLLAVAFFAVLSAQVRGEDLDLSIRQLIVSIAPDWNATQGKLVLLERDRAGWKRASPVIPVLYGREGLAWGRGVLGKGEPGRQKMERDGRAPAGLFRIGRIYTYDESLPEGADFPFHTVTKADAWIDDPAHPQYNQHVRIDPANPPPWFEKQKMRHNDFAYRWLVEIRHNADPPVPNAGSAIFFHIRRGPTRPSSGCTTMAEDNLVRLMQWLRKDANPHYLLLPSVEYLRKRESWGLPPEDVIAPLLGRG